MRFPIDGAFRIGYGFGPRGNIGVPGASADHEGIDIVRPNSGLPVGTPVHCPLDGKVLIAGNSGGGAGYTTLTEHKHNGTTYRIRINHYSKWNVKAGQKVKEGDILGRSGGQPGQPGAGASGGPHCHVGVYKVVNGRAVPIDPGPFFGLGSTKGIGTTKPDKTFPAFASGGGSNTFDPEEDDMTPEQAAQLNSIFNAIFRGGNSMADEHKSIGQSLAEIQAKVGPIYRGGEAVSLRQEIADAKTAGISLQAQVAALTDAIKQISVSGAQVDYDRIAAAAKAAADSAVARLQIVVDPA